jgi:hypothetical protein
MILSDVARKTGAKQEEWVCTQTHLDRRKKMGLELEKEEWYAPVEKVMKVRNPQLIIDKRNLITNQK